MDLGNKNILTKQDGTQTAGGQILDVLTGKTQPTVNFEATINRNSVAFATGCILVVGLILILVWKKA